MGLADAYQHEIDASLDNLAVMPPAPPQRIERSAWSAPFRGLAAGAMQAAASIADEVEGFGHVMGAAGTDSAGGMFSTQSPEERAQSIQARARLNAEGVDMDSEVGDALRGRVKDFRPDPNTAGLAEHILYEVPRFVVKAAGYMMAMTPLPGATALGADEALTTSADLRGLGVDKQAAFEVGALAGAVGGVTAVLPLTGTILQRVGLAVVGGPGAFMAQMAGTRAVLDDASYGELAQQYDPLDPTGLAISALVPLPFLAHGIIGLRARAGRVPQTQIDAAMVHNLTLQQDVRPPDVDPATVVEPRQPEMPAPLAEPDEAAQHASAQMRLKSLATERPELQQQMETMSREAKAGTDTDLGTDDAPLLRAAAECFLATAG